MKILLVTPQSKDTALGAVGNYCKKALINLGYEIDVFDFRASQYFKSSMGAYLKKTIKKFYRFPREQLSLAKSLENKKMNIALINKVKQYRPDAVLVLMGDDIFAETLKEIKNQGVIAANWFTDTVLDPRRQRSALIKNISSHYDYFFIYDNEAVLNFTQIDAPCVKSIPLACDSSIHKSISLSRQEKEKYGSQVCFVGSLDSMREDLLRSLTDFKLGIWGNWWEKDVQLLKFYRKKHVYFQEAAKIYNASDITLDIHIFFGTNNKAFDINPRVFEATACGAFVLTNENPYLADLYEIDKEIVCYKSKQELREKIKYYLKHPDQRKTIAQKGQQKAHREHTYEKRLQKIISTVKNKEG
ncbi:MAG: glycosyltransferase [Candidatus Omnitrophica bacterium]|nr:glycosyltransferase [Candidatus Omnitrophota bacterium]